jgi:manganese/zinc/iron transport system ATP- binding protein
MNVGIEIHDLSTTYNHRPVLWGIDTNIPTNSLTAIVGPNGAGKSTLLKSMMGLLPISSGYVQFLGKPIDEVRNLISYMPQREAVDWDFPINVYDVVLMGTYGKLGLFKRPGAAEKEIVQHSLELVGMQDFVKRQISELSGGQQQRVFFARALAQQAQIYLMDEPFAGIDATTEEMLLSLLISMKNDGKTIVVVHHDVQSVIQKFDYALLLNLRLIAAGHPKEILTEALLHSTYSGRLSILSEVSELIKQQEIAIRVDK